MKKKSMIHVYGMRNKVQYEAKAEDHGNYNLRNPLHNHLFFIAKSIQ